MIKRSPTGSTTILRVQMTETENRTRSDIRPGGQGRTCPMAQHGQ